MKTMAAGKFKDVCLKTLDDVSKNRISIVITKRGKPLAKLVPYAPPAKASSLKGSVLREKGNPLGTGESWDADTD
jgi:prevent-host-death family protein